jgi:hypothetical protein
MPTIEERVAYLEGRMQDHTRLWTDLRDGATDLRADVNRRFDEVRAEFSDFRTDVNRRFEEVRLEIADVRSDMNRQFAGVRAEFSSLRADMDRRFDEVRAEARSDTHRLEDKVDRHFVWLTGMLLTSMVGTIGAVIGLYFK